MFMNDNYDFNSSNSAETRLMAEARRHITKAAAAAKGEQQYIAFDCEFKYATDDYAMYRQQEGESAAKKLRWPFCNVAAISWCLLTFNALQETPTVSALTTLTAEDHHETEMVIAFFELLNQFPKATLVGWGTEQKDIPVLRRTAATYGLVLPPQLKDTNPYAVTRLDLCNAVSNQAACVHLPEYAAGVGIPSKPCQSKAIGDLVVRGDWSKVREQITADVFTTSIITIRHLISFGQVSADFAASERQLTHALQNANPHSAFFNVHLRGWVEHRRDVLCKSAEISLAA